MTDLLPAAGRRRLPLVALLSANAISLSGEAVTAVAIPWFVYETTGSAAQMGVVGFFTVLPRVLATFFGGALVDRVGFQRTSVIADVCSGLAIAAIPLLSLTGHLTFPLLLALVFAGAIFDGPGATARESMVPQLVTLAGVPLARVNAIYQMVQRLSLLIGPAAAGVLIAWRGATSVLWIDAATFAVSALMIGLLVPRSRPAAAAATGPRDPYWRELTEGLRFIWRDHLLRVLFAIICLLNFVDAPLTTVTLPIFVEERFGDVEAFGALVSLLGAGAVIGSLGYAAIGPRFSRYSVFVAAYLLIGVPFWLLAVAPNFGVAAIAMAWMGFVASPINPILMTVRQERVPEAVRARVFGAITAMAWVAIPLGQLAGGLIVEAGGVTLMFVLMGASYLVVTLAIPTIPVLRQLDPVAAPDRAGPAPAER